jgi:hypothetical protein
LQRGPRQHLLTGIGEWLVVGHVSISTLLVLLVLRLHLVACIELEQVLVVLLQVRVELRIDVGEIGELGLVRLDVGEEGGILVRAILGGRTIHLLVPLLSVLAVESAVVYRATIVVQEVAVHELVDIEVLDHGRLLRRGLHVCRRTWCRPRSTVRRGHHRLGLGLAVEHVGLLVRDGGILLAIFDIIVDGGLALLRRVLRQTLLCEGGTRHSERAVRVRSSTLQRRAHRRVP